MQKKKTGKKEAKLIFFLLPERSNYVGLSPTWACKQTMNVVDKLKT